jgi:hypothetical protein
LYCVYDAKVQLYSMPFFSQSDAAAARSFKDALNHEGSLLQKHPEDFALFRVCDVEDSDGTISVPPVPALVFQGRSLVKES